MHLGGVVRSASARGATAHVHSGRLGRVGDARASVLRVGRQTYSELERARRMHAGAESVEWGDTGSTVEEIEAIAGEQRRAENKTKS